MQELPFEAIASVFRMELSCKSNLVAMLFPKLWHGTVVQRLPCKAMSQSFAWNFRAKAALQSIFVSYRIELSCIELLLHGTVVQRLPSPKLPVKLLRGTVVQKLPCEAIS